MVKFWICTYRKGPPNYYISGFIPSYTHLQPWLDRVCWGYNYLITRGAPSCTVDGCWWLKICTTCYLWNRMKKWDQLPFPQLVQDFWTINRRKYLDFLSLSLYIYIFLSAFLMYIFLVNFGTNFTHLEDPRCRIVKIGTQHEVGFKNLGNLSYTGCINILVLFVTCLRKKNRLETVLWTNIRL